MDKDGYVDEVQLARLAQADRINLTRFTPQKFQQLCILCGCDYLDSIRNVGPVKAATALNRHSDVMHVRTRCSADSLQTPPALCRRWAAVSGLTRPSPPPPRPTSSVRRPSMRS